MEAETLAGTPFSLRGLRGGPALINLWATWCAPCRAETPFLQEIHEEYGPRGLQVVGLSMDGEGNRDGVEAFIEEFEVTYTMVHDFRAEAMDLFHTIGLPATFLLDAEGRFQVIRLGPVSETDREFLAALEALTS
jgi:thiol-disulfide isomerase/thioredoxin